MVFVVWLVRNFLLNIRVSRASVKRAANGQARGLMVSGQVLIRSTIMQDSPTVRHADRDRAALGAMQKFRIHRSTLGKLDGSRIPVVALMTLAGMPAHPVELAAHLSSGSQGTAKSEGDMCGGGRILFRYRADDLALGQFHADRRSYSNIGRDRGW